MPTSILQSLQHGGCVLGVQHDYEAVLFAGLNIHMQQLAHAGMTTLVLEWFKLGRSPIDGGDESLGLEKFFGKKAYDDKDKDVACLLAKAHRVDLFVANAVLPAAKRIFTSPADIRPLQMAYELGGEAKAALTTQQREFCDAVYSKKDGLYQLLFSAKAEGVKVVAGDDWRFSSKLLGGAVARLATMNGYVSDLCKALAEQDKVPLVIAGAEHVLDIKKSDQMIAGIASLSGLDAILTGLDKAAIAHLARVSSVEDMASLDVEQLFSEAGAKFTP